MFRTALQFAVFLLLCAGGIPSPAPAQETRSYWVFFRDKGPGLPTTGRLEEGSIARREALQHLSPRSLDRRSRVLPSELIVEAEDLPLCPSYLDQVCSLGAVLRQESRWTNAASFFMTAGQAAAARELTCALAVEPVAGLRTSPHHAVARQVLKPVPTAVSEDEYGLTRQQLEILGIPTLHSMGITGRGVLIGLLDSGFRWRAHEALRDRSVIAEYDFLFHRPVTSNQENDVPLQDAHGTLTFSVIGAYAPGKALGAAYGADFALAKTEYLPTETRAEEDTWAAAIEWLDSLGADVVSSSVGYDVFDPPDSGYSWDNGDMDGRTSVVARAATRAARLGILVCTSMGNEGNGDGTRGTLLTPADADSILSVGAITFSRRLWIFSSTGPTSDGRIKPDLVAPGVGIYHAVVPGPDTYSRSQGNSVSTPLVAGSAALLLSVRPGLSPIEARDALRSTADTIDAADHPDTPNNFTGWGLVSALKAVLSQGVVFGNRPEATVEGGASVVTLTVLSQSGLRPDSVLLWYGTGDDGLSAAIPMQMETPSLFPTSGRYRCQLPRYPYGTIISFMVTAVDSAGGTYSSPPPESSARWKLRAGAAGLEPPGGFPAGYALYQNYPNPFNGMTNISFDLPISEYVTVSVYDILGRKVQTLADGPVAAGLASTRAPLVFDGSGLASGVYIVRMSTPAFSGTRKMLLVQ